MRIFLHQVRDDFRVGFGGKLVAFFLQLFLQFEVVLDNSVVHHDDLASAVAMRMGVLFRGAAVRGPACMADSVGAFERRLGDGLFEITKFSRSAADFQLPGLRHNGDAGRIIAAVLELAQAFDDDRHDFLGPDIADYSAHTRRLLRKLPAA